MIDHLRRAAGDIWDNGFVSAITFVTIGLLVMMVGAFALFLDNTGQIVDSWKKGVRLMAYLAPGIDGESSSAIRDRILKMKNVRKVRFISKEEALESLRQQLKRRDSLLDGLEGNPLPDSFEIETSHGDGFETTGFGPAEDLALAVEALEGIDEVEYGKQWFGRFSAVFELFRFLGFAMGGIFVLAAVLIVANTIRLVIYTRREELRIMRLVGACDEFIKYPFFFQAMMLAAAGALAGLAGLYAGYAYGAATMEAGFSIVEVRFLSWRACATIVGASMFLGWSGCYLALRQYLDI